MVETVGDVIRGRFAPSPSGRMHLGNVFTALLAWLSVRAKGGTLVLRMEDLDPDRCREEYAQQLAEDLEWLGLPWDEGYGKGGPHGPYRQSERTDFYASQFERLADRGLVYPCYCTRAQRLAASAPHRSDGKLVYDGRCRALTAEERQELDKRRRPAWRVAVPDEEILFTDRHLGVYQEDLSRDCGDFIIRRSDGVYAYQLAVVADDGDMEINEVVRGQDLLDSTPRQLFLYKKLGYRPPEFYHVPLLVDPDGRRLSKRDGDLDMGALREKFTAGEIVGRLAFLAGLQEKPRSVTPAELAGVFAWEKVPVCDVTVDRTLWQNP